MLHDVIGSIIHKSTKEIKMKIPEWQDILRKVENKDDLDPLERFIYVYEPAGESAETAFRKDLNTVLDWVQAQPVIKD